MNVKVVEVIQEMVSGLRSGKINPQGDDLAMQLLECFKPYIEPDTMKNGNGHKVTARNLESVLKANGCHGPDWGSLPHNYTANDAFFSNSPKDDSINLTEKQSIEFDLSALNSERMGFERGNPLQAELERDTTEIASDGLEAMLLWIWSNRNMKYAFVKFVAISALMRPELLDSQSYAELGKKLSVSTDCISRNALEFQERFGVHFSRRQGLSAGREKKLQAARLSGFKNRGNAKFLRKEKV